MNQHILSSIGEKIAKQNMASSYYDFKSQQSYRDEKFLKKINLASAKHRHDTSLSETLETSDKDYDIALCDTTTETRTVETSDHDYLFCGLTTQTTFTLEDSDKDY